jgi:glycosyltransferase involved in cell wall biosynthesis
MKILVISSWPPQACGIAKYAEQQVDVLRDEGHLVDVLSPPDGDGDFQDNLKGGLRPLRLLRYLWAYDEAWLQYTPYFFYDSQSRFGRMLTSLAFLAVMLAYGRRVTIVVHETAAAPGQEKGRGIRHRLDRWWWRMAGRVAFHSEREREAFCAAFRLSPSRRAFEIWPHHRYFKPRCALSQAEARRRLGVEPGVTLVACLGFIQPHKGFDRVIIALGRLPEAKDLRLKIVGSVRLAWDEAHAYARRLHEMAAQDPRVEVIESFVDDELFDAWLVACDYLAAPYRMIWSSGVAARARLYGKPLLAAAAGALPEQLTEGSLMFHDDEELLECLRKIAGQAKAHGSSPAQAGLEAAHA